VVIFTGITCPAINHFPREVGMGLGVFRFLGKFQYFMLGLILHRGKFATWVGRYPPELYPYSLCRSLGIKIYPTGSNGSFPVIFSMM